MLILSILLALVLAGLLLARFPSDATKRLQALGFEGPPWVLRLDGVELMARLERAGHTLVSAPLPASPVPHDQLARALGRGDLLAALAALGASVHASGLTSRLPGLRGRSRLRALRAHLAAVADLARRLSELPHAEALVRWYLDGGEDPHSEASRDRHAAFDLVLKAHPEAPETFGLCRLELDAPPQIAARARAHLAAHGR
jgi:uncharacterized protein YjeT (DUF2065 family)